MPPFQSRVNDWMLATFGSAVAADTQERNWRFGEEALELMQANGATREQVLALVDYVFNRPVGELRQEVGGTLVCLAALCTAADLDMEPSGEAELIRCWQNQDHIRAKHQSKTLRSPLPGVAPALS